MSPSLYPQFSANPVLYRQAMKEAVLRNAGIGGLGAYCDDPQAQAAVNGTLTALEIIGGAMASGSKTSAQVGKTGAQFATAANSFTAQWCADTQGAVGGPVDGGYGAREIDAMLERSQARVQNLANQISSNQALELQRRTTAQVAQQRNMMILGGVALAGVAAVLLLRR